MVGCDIILISIIGSTLHRINAELFWHSFQYWNGSIFSVNSNLLQTNSRIIVFFYGKEWGQNLLVELEDRSPQNMFINQENLKAIYSTQTQVDVRWYFFNLRQNPENYDRINFWNWWYFWSRMKNDDLLFWTFFNILSWNCKENLLSWTFSDYYNIN